MKKYILLFSCMLLLLPLSAQQRKITGTVSDKNGETLPGVTIVIKGSGQGTVTDANGAYSLQVPDEKAILVFSFIGFTTIEEQVGSRLSMDVQLSEESQILEEVVVVGYGTQRKGDVTGSVVSVKGRDLTHIPTGRTDQALQGMASGVMVQNADGAPGGNTLITIRGSNSIAGGNAVLVVVDGLQGADINLINPNDIESMEILKDASATAIYGARGSNGVILITTKKGQTGKPTIAYGYSIGFQDVTKKLEKCSPGEYARVANDYTATFDWDGVSMLTPLLPYTEEQIRDFDTGLRGTDWEDACYRTGILQDHKLSVNGGSENFKYFVSAGLMDQAGIVIDSKYQRINVRSNLNFTINKWMEAGLNLNLMKAEGNVQPNGEGANVTAFNGQVISNVAFMDPCSEIYDINGNYIFRPGSAQVPGSRAFCQNNIVFWNPVALAKETLYTNKQYLQQLNAYLEFKILPGLTFRTSLALSVRDNNTLMYWSKNTQQGVSNSGRGSESMNNSRYLQNSNILTYNQVFGNHKITLTGVAEQSYSDSETLNSGNVTGFANDEVGIYAMGLATIRNAVNNSFSDRKLNSWLGRFFYSYKDRYMLTVSYRADGSSVFGEYNKWGYFPSASLAWDVAKESFLKDVKVISLMKFRGSWGITGNQGIGPYGTLAQISTGSTYGYPYTGGTTKDNGVRLSRVANPGLKWESTTQTNFGVDMGFFKQRLTVTVDWYKKLTDDLLMSMALPTYTGFSSVLRNVGSIQNQGLELSINATPVVKKDFRWSTGFNISGNKSKVDALSYEDEIIYVNTLVGAGVNIYEPQQGYSLKQLREGEPLNQFYGWTFAGIWKEKDRGEAGMYGQIPGEVRWKEFPDENDEMTGRLNRDKDGNNPIGNPEPKFFFGWNNNFSYKGFDLSILIQGTYGNDIFNALNSRMMDIYYGGVSRAWLNRWTPENENTDVPGYDFIKSSERAPQYAGLPSRSTMISGETVCNSRWIEDGSYIRLKNVSLTYSLPHSLIKKLAMSRLAVSVSATNLLTLTKYKGYDPEVSSFNSTTGGLGIDAGNYPASRVITFGINVTF